MRKTIIIVCIVALTSCTKESENHIAGKWLMHKVIQNGKDVSNQHNPFNERFITFKLDSTFESGGRPFGKNTGKFTLNLSENTLFLDSDAGPDDDSQWKVTFDADTMKWQGYGSEWAENFQIIQIRDK